MALRIPENHRLVFTELLCETCHNEMYLPQGSSSDSLRCPFHFCDGIMWANGDIDIFTKRQHDAT